MTQTKPKQMRLTLPAQKRFVNYKRGKILMAKMIADLERMLK